MTENKCVSRFSVFRNTEYFFITTVATSAVDDLQLIITLLICHVYAESTTCEPARFSLYY